MGAPDGHARPVAAHINQSKPEPPLSLSRPWRRPTLTTTTEKGQNFRLRLVEAFAQYLRDQDSGLIDLLRVQDAMV